MRSSNKSINSLRHLKSLKLINKIFKTKFSSQFLSIALIASMCSSNTFAAWNDPSDIDLTRTLTAVGTGPYFGLGSTYDGSELVVMQPNIHRDFSLLQQNLYMMKKTHEVNGPSSPYVQLSGMAEVQVAVQNKAKNYVDLTSSNLDLDAWVNRWITAYANFGIEYDESQKSYFRMILAFVTLGDLSQYPFYLTAGQIYIPFGSFSTGTSDLGTLPRAMGRIYDKAVSVGYYPGNGLHVTGAVYNGWTKNSSTSNLDQVAGTISYKKKLNIMDIPANYKVGASYTNNIGETAGIRQIFKQGAILKHFVPGGDVFASVTVGDYTLRTEYISALKQFSSKDLLQGGHKVKPSSYLAEADYRTTMFGKTTTFTAHYSEVAEAAMATVIEYQMGINTSVNILKNTLLSMELSHRKTHHRSNQITNTSGLKSYIDTTLCNSINSNQNNTAKNVFVTTLDVYY